MSALFGGKVALVTGGSSGIGRAAALAIAKEGAKVFIADIDAGGGERTATEINDAGRQASFVRTDVSSAPEVEALVRKIADTCGRLDCAFNNAGVEGARGPLADCTEEDWDRVMRVNLKGIWLCMRQELRLMSKQGGGSIVNTASVPALSGAENASAYAAASHGIIGLVKSAALEYAKAGIRINAVCPGVIRTPMIERLMAHRPEPERPKLEAQMAAHSPMGRLGSPEEVTQAVVWLLSDQAAFVTGSFILVDGGTSAR